MRGFPGFCLGYSPAHVLLPDHSTRFCECPNGGKREEKSRDERSTFELNEKVFALVSSPRKIFSMKISEKDVVRNGGQLPLNPLHFSDTFVTSVSAVPSGQKPHSDKGLVLV